MKASGYVIAVVGPFGSGCSYVSELICKMFSFKKVSLSDILRQEFNGCFPGQVASRDRLQDFGDEIRRTNGSDYLAKRAAEQIGVGGVDSFVIDSIRNPAEVKYLKENLPNVFLFGVFSDRENRWKRVKIKSYNDDRQRFDNDDMRDSGEKVVHGQRVTDTFRMSDVVILNNDKIFKGNDADDNLKAQIKTYVDYIRKESDFKPNLVETCMAMAYACSMRSSCLKRQVGAVIVDRTGCVISSGYNEVPPELKSCQNTYGQCYRAKVKKDFRERLNEKIGDEVVAGKAFECFDFKNLDHCRALHAEENAIVSIARNGVSTSLAGATLFTTTYPCPMCANKIAQVGIRQVVYFEPYSLKDAEDILKRNGVTLEPFQGVTYNGYFRLMKEAPL